MVEQKARVGVRLPLEYGHAVGAGWDAKPPAVFGAHYASRAGGVEQVEKAGRRFDVRQWIKAMHWTAIRAALLVCDDLPGAVRLLCETHPNLVGRPIKTLVAEDTLVADLLGFWFSDEAMTLRRRAGILPMGTSAW